MSQLQNVKISDSPLLLTQCEAIIEGELENLKKLFRALELIEESELYKEKYKNFALYCQHRWKMSGALDMQGELTFNFKTKDNNELPKIS